jgi:L-alanine-DL-glutamate epimerase-like enolase superfamily enzyme
MLSMSVDTLELPLARPFTISRGSRTAVTVVRVTLRQGEHVAYGECTPTAHYQESAASVCAQLAAVHGQVEEGLSRQQLQLMLPKGAARNALDCAMWRLEGLLSGKSLWQLVGMTPPSALVTAETLSLAPLEQMVEAAKTALAGGARLLKIKLDRDQVIEKVAAIRAVAGNTTLIVDANEAWHGLDLQSLFQALHGYQVAMIEQPLPAGNDHDLARCQHPIPICADESCHQRTDIAGLRDRYEMINIKLDKCGGLTEALAMAEEAKAQGMRLMVGCMLGSSLAMEAALPIALQAECVDLDGPIWLAEDFVPGLRYQQGQIWL